MAKNTFYMKNEPYWFDNNLYNTTTGELPDVYTDHIEGVGNVLDNTFEFPDLEDYYAPVTRLDELTNVNYRPSGHGFEQFIYRTDNSSYLMSASGMCATNIFTFDWIHETVYDIAAEYTISNVNNIMFVPVSIKLFTTSSDITYYLDLAVRFQYNGGTEPGGPYYSCSFICAERARNNANGVSTWTVISSMSGQRLYQRVTLENDTVRPLIAINSDKTTKATIYGAWLWADIMHTPQLLETYPLRATAKSDNGHTFYQMEPDVGTGTDYFYGRAVSVTWDLEATLDNLPDITPAWDSMIDVIGPLGPDSDEEGYPEEPGDGHFDDTSDTIVIPEEPVIGISNVGFVNVYKTESQSLQNMGVELFPPLSYTNPGSISSSDTTAAIVDGFNAIVTALANIPSIIDQQVAATLINYIIDCHVIPVTPDGGSLENIKVGYKTLTATGKRLSSDYVTYPCGSIYLGEYYSSFADFLSTAKLYLPFVGFVPARPEWFYRDTLTVTYRFNVIDGSFMAYVQSTGKYVNNGNQGGTIVSQYSGNACVHLPITGVTYASMVSGLVGAGAGAVASAGSGNIAGAATSALNAAGVHGDIPQSNAYTSSGCFLGCRRPFLMIERVVTNYSATFKKERGIPSNISKKLQNVTGFAIVGKVHLDGITATDSEKAELEKLLSEGVIF